MNLRRYTEAKAARDEANAEREAAMEAARKVAEVARLRRIEEMKAEAVYSHTTRFRCST